MRLSVIGKKLFGRCMHVPNPNHLIYNPNDQMIFHPNLGSFSKKKKKM